MNDFGLTPGQDAHLDTILDRARSTPTPQIDAAARDAATVNASATRAACGHRLCKSIAKHTEDPDACDAAASNAPLVAGGQGHTDEEVSNVGGIVAWAILAGLLIIAGVILYRFSFGGAK